MVVRDKLDILLFMFDFSLLEKLWIFPLKERDVIARFTLSMHQKIFFLACLITSSFLNNINNIILKATGTEISDSNYEISKLCNCDS